jgi:hypothetical protein
MATTGMPAGGIGFEGIATLEIVSEFTTLQPGLGQQAIAPTLSANEKALTNLVQRLQRER